jgi:pimeloyl-ACP methyl ester carboxylesterase
MALNLICETVGSGPPLVVLHGLFGSSGNWRGVARALACTHTIVSVDLRNRGASPWTDSMDYVEMAEDVLQLIDRLELKRPMVMGHSMGGKVAMALALRHPARIAGLIVVDIAPVSYADTLTPFAEAMRSANVMAAASGAEVQRRLQQAVPDDQVVPFLMRNLVAHNDHFDWRLNLPGISLAMPQLCAFPTSLFGLRFDGPVAVIAGTNSEYVAQSGRDSFQPMFSQAEVEFIDDAGHWVHADQPAAFVGSVRRLLQGDMQSSIAEQAL